MKQGVIEQYEDNQLAVAISDLQVVRDTLARLEVGVEAEEEDARLGLALLTLRDVAAAATKLRNRDSGLPGRVADAKWHGRAPNGIEPCDLDLLIFWLRESFRYAYDGWVPTMGKNRVLDPVRGLPYIDGGGDGDPRFGGLSDPRVSSSANGGSSPEPPRLNAPREWKPRKAQPGQGVRVGLLDTPLYPNEWLAGGYEAAPADLLQVPAKGSPPPVSAGHATFVAGLILRRAPGAELVVRPALNDDAVGKAWDVAKDMVSFIGSGVDILNMSFGCYTDDGEPPLVLARAVSLVSAEILLVAAAGNNGNIDELKERGRLPDASWTRGLTSKTPMWPAAFDQVIAVGATDGNKPAPFSPKTPWVDLTAPGVNVESTYLEGEVKLASTPGISTACSSGFAYWDGTSFAAAAVSGAVAAKILPGRRDAWAALAWVRAAREGGIRPFTKPCP
jgi:membrane-anchored mycosin MYCP